MATKPSKTGAFVERVKLGSKMGRNEKVINSEMTKSKVVTSRMAEAYNSNQKLGRRLAATEKILGKK